MCFNLLTRISVGFLWFDGFAKTYHISYVWAVYCKLKSALHFWIKFCVLEETRFCHSVKWQADVSLESNHIQCICAVAMMKSAEFRHVLFYFACHSDDRMLVLGELCSGDSTYSLWSLYWIICSVSIGLSCSNVFLIIDYLFIWTVKYWIRSQGMSSSVGSGLTSISAWDMHTVQYICFYYFTYALSGEIWAGKILLLISEYIN